MMRWQASKISQAHVAPGGQRRFWAANPASFGSREAVFKLSCSVYCLRSERREFHWLTQRRVTRERRPPSCSALRVAPGTYNGFFLYSWCVSRPLRPGGSGLNQQLCLCPPCPTITRVGLRILLPYWSVWPHLIIGYLPEFRVRCSNMSDLSEAGP
jgi:hypothetical protein